MPKRNRYYTIAKRLASRYKKAKEFEKKLKEDKQRFFDLATVEMNDENLLARKTVEVLGNQAFAHKYVKEHFAGWLATGSRAVKGAPAETWEVMLIEDPQYKPFKYVDPDLGMVFEKEIRQGAIMLDEDRLQDENPELWDRITETITIVSDPDTLSPEDTAALQEYVYRAKPTVALRAPRKAKPEELA